jgi:hypothetical protein
MQERLGMRFGMRFDEVLVTECLGFIGEEQVLNIPISNPGVLRCLYDRRIDPRNA